MFAPAGTPKEAIAKGKRLVAFVPLPEGSILVIVAAIGWDRAVLGAANVASGLVPTYGARIPGTRLPQRADRLLFRRQ